MRRVRLVAALVGAALSLAACAGPGYYAYNSGYGPSSDASTCGVYGTCAPQGGPYDMQGNPSGGM
jgi:hypothetical protein